ncbi:MAG: hypothetical protein GYB64_07990 [Chloroflexi bacterium]|nr:hypothetical protein [Chloroflexota bacterium]
MRSKKLILPGALFATALLTVTAIFVIMTGGGRPGTEMICDPGSDSFTLTVNIDAPESAIYPATLFVEGGNVESGSTSLNLALNEGGNRVTVPGVNLVAIDEGATVSARLEVPGIGTYFASCTENAAFIPYVKPVGPQLAAAFQAAPFNGVPPCGVFDVNGHGFKIASAPDFPACPYPAVTVACMNNAGTWTQENIFNLVVTPAEVNFTSGQHGTCALFSTLSTPVPTEAP